MPAHHLTATLRTAPEQVARHVLDVLAGADLTTTATQAGVTTADLADAVDTFHRGGTDALARSTQDDCYSIRIAFPDWAHAETTATTHLAPALHTLRDTGAISGWWFLRKYPHWRLRLHDPDYAAIHRTLRQLEATDAITGWWPTIYEPETAAFGGPATYHTIHRHFWDDTHGVLTYLATPPALGRRETSLLLLTELMHAAGLDTFERGDIYHRVAQLRPPLGAVPAENLEQFTNQLHGLLHGPPPTATDLVHPDGPLDTARPWFTAFGATGRQLHDHAAHGTTTRGIREILVHLVIFHWNRLGLSATQQALLATAAERALLPPDSKCWASLL